MQYWIKAIRLRTLPLSLAGIFMGCFLAGNAVIIRWDIFILSCLTTISFQIVSNLANDYGDGIRGTDLKRIGPQRMTASGKISPKAMKNAVIISSILSLIFGLSLIYVAFGTISLKIEIIFFLLLGVASIIASVKYTIGRNPYGYLGFGDLFVFVFFGLVSVCGSYYLFTKSISWKILLPASAVGLFCVSVLNINNIRDMNDDSYHRKLTLPVRVGKYWANWYQSILVITPFILLLIFAIINEFKWENLLYLILLFPIYNHLRKIWKSNKEELNIELKRISILTIMFVLLSTGIPLFIDKYFY